MNRRPKGGMRHFWKATLAFWSVSVAGGCVSTVKVTLPDLRDVSPLSSSAQRIELPGFSIVPPQGENWFSVGLRYRRDSEVSFVKSSASGKSISVPVASKGGLRLPLASAGVTASVDTQNRPVVDT